MNIIKIGKMSYINLDHFIALVKPVGLNHHVIFLSNDKTINIDEEEFDIVSKKLDLVIKELE